MGAGRHPRHNRERYLAAAQHIVVFRKEMSEAVESHGDDVEVKFAGEIEGSLMEAEYRAVGRTGPLRKNYD